MNHPSNNLDYNEGYDAGYNAGYEAGFNQGHAVGIREGGTTPVEPYHGKAVNTGL